MKLNKSIQKTALLLLSTLAVASCGQSGGDSGTSNTGDYTTVKIAFAECGFGRQFLLDWETDYNAKHPTEKIKLELDGDAQMTQNILPRIQSGKNLPDIVMVLSTNWQPWCVQNYLEPIDDIYSSTVEGGTSTVKDYMVDGLNEFGKVKGHYYALPWSVNPCGIMYNEGMFEQYGWEIPETFNDLLTLCETIKTDTAGTVAPFSWSGTTAAYWDFTVLQWWAQYEGVSNWETFWKFESPEVYKQEGRLKALQCFQQLICNGDGTAKNSIDGASGKKFMESQMSFVKGEAAMMSNGAWLENEMKSSLPSGFKMALMKTPKVDGAKEDALYCTSGDFLVIPKKAANKEAAKKFLAYTCSEDACRIFTKDSGGIRPFKYKASETENITDFTKEVCKLWETSENVYMTSDSVMYYQNNLNTWPGYGSPYNKMVQEDDTAQDVCDYIYDYVSKNWNSMKADAGDFGE